MQDNQVLVRVYDRNDLHLEDLFLDQSAAVFISPGRYLSDCDWASATMIDRAAIRKVISVGSERDDLKQPERAEAFVSVWVDAV